MTSHDSPLAWIHRTLDQAGRSLTRYSTSEVELRQ